MININQLSMSFGAKLLFYDANLLLADHARYALVGANGAGKSTLFKLLTGEEEPTAGMVALPKDAVVGWLKQDQFRYEDTPIIDIVIQGKPRLWDALREKDDLLSDVEWDDKKGHRLAILEEIIAHQQGYTATTFAEKLLIGLGVPMDYHAKPLKSLSGGYKLRVLLAQALFEEPDILLLDEPTNHLDIVTIQWLEKYLKTEFSGTLIFISHDVAFINQVADQILDIDYGEIRQYSGHYTTFLAEKKLIEEQKEQLKKQAESRIAEMQQFVDRFRASATRARMAQSRMKMIEKVELPDIKHTSRISPSFRFELEKPSGKNVLRVENISKHFSDTKIIGPISFEIKRGEKMAILGENGVGKSTLIKMLVNAIVADNGHSTWGHEVKISYFSQDHHDTLNQQDNVLAWLMHQVVNRTEQQIRKTLAQVLFTKDEVEKDILALSGGEAARLLLAKMMLESGNVLVLDEPTNHLDLEGIEALADALQSYAGTVILVSHDRHFIKKIATRTLFLAKTPSGSSIAT